MPHHDQQPAAKTWGAYLQRRRLVKRLRQLLREARHVRNLRADVAAPEMLAALAAAGRAAQAALADRAAPAALAAAGQRIADALRPVMPPRRRAALRENLEIILVAVAVAMAFRTYFIQPFKIPTASMSPTLNGIYHEPVGRRGWPDQPPCNLLQWLLRGAWYVELRAQQAGRVRLASDGEQRRLFADGRWQALPPGMSARVADGDEVVPGQLLACGRRILGDHIFVDKVSWNFRAPRRGEIMVFKTAGIRHRDIKANEHYVKRLVGLPNEKLEFRPPALLVNGALPGDSSTMARIMAASDGYVGYQAGGRQTGPGEYLAARDGTVQLGPDDFFACGDNQFNSLDSRYWGPVPRANLVGPAFMVYWPFSRHWGPTP